MAQETVERVDHFGGFVGYHHIKPDAPAYESGVGLGEDTLELLKERMGYYVRYYENLGCQVTEATITRFCSHCDGTGKVPSKRNRHKSVRCPACRGKDSTVALETWINIPKALFRYGPDLYRYDVFPQYKADNC
jgi:hypothetical protein